ncbi:MetQ/NlpA family ABC transporter substrate-binding protein [Vreelandella nigrificans]|uniref:Lipoprotein n=1 Tax=Vreelandella nigrificans TaxID=2042704 RepID=A0A2A4HMB9_9GAMM|nr:MetQ/NlpA family ABC transporter substrate-binding protein [Halomonas nigrificans]PCF95567.1 metal ABC transporter substrate-binding protein [Halomonas nigrificans]
MTTQRRRRVTRSVSGLFIGALSLAVHANEATDTLTIMASSLPHAAILEFADSYLLDNLSLEIIEITGQMNPNGFLAGGDIDANFFQHVPYLETDGANFSQPLTVIATVHIEPLGLYSSRYDTLEALPKGARIAVPDNPTNLSRALFLLEDAELLSLAPGVSRAELTQATELDIAENPYELEIVPIDAPLLMRALADVDAAIVNGNWVLEAGYTPDEDALVLETVHDNPYANILVTREELADDERLIALADALESEQVAEFIRERYDGAVLPVH